MTDPMTYPAQRSAVDQIMGALLVGAIAIAALPSLAVAVALAAVIDGRGWRRWPAVAIGVALTTAAVALGAHRLYAHALRHLWWGARHGHGPRAPDVIGLLALGVPVGISAGPLVQTVLHGSALDESTLARRADSHRRRAQVQARRAAPKARWPCPDGRTVLGTAIEGGIDGWVIPSGLRRLVAPRLEVWGRQALLLGETGSGKTVTALTLAAEAMRLGWRVYWIDGKADLFTATRFLDAAREHGLTARDATAQPIDGWRGTPDAVVSRLLATQRFTEPYYEGITRVLLREAVGAWPPRSFSSLVERIGARSRRAPPGSGPPVSSREIAGVRSRYDGIAWAVGGHLDGDWSYEDTEVAYVPVGRPENRSQAAEIGAFLLEDLLHWAMDRKPRDQRALVIVDEFSKLSDRPGAAVDLVERVRSYGVGVMLVAQTWASVGPDETSRNRLVGTAGTVIVHQLKQPTEACAVAGSVAAPARPGALRAGPTHLAKRPVVDPDDVRRLGVGESYVIHAGQAVRVSHRQR